MARYRIASVLVTLTFLTAMMAASSEAQTSAGRRKTRPVSKIGGSVVTGGKLIRVKIVSTGRSAVVRKSGLFAFRGKNLSGQHTLVFIKAGKKFSMPVTVPPSAALTLKDVSLDSATASAKADEEDLTFDGTMTAVDCSASPNTLTVSYGPSLTATIQFDPSTTLIINAATQTTITTCADLNALNGSPVEVEARVNPDGSYFANRITVNHSSHDESDIEVQGTITSTSCPNSITITRSDATTTVINITSTTEIEVEDSSGPASCTDLSAGEYVDVEGVLQPDSSVTARQIQVHTNAFESDGTINSTNCSATPPSISFTPTSSSTALTVTISATTEIQVNDNASASCTDLTPGDAHVEGVTQPDATVAATRIEQSASSD